MSNSSKLTSPRPLDPELMGAARPSRDNSVLSERVRLGIFITFAALVAFAGGSSRSDVYLLIILRPAVVLLLAVGLCLLTKEQVRRVQGLLMLLMAFPLLALLQLIPLPLEVWSSLPQRALVAETSALLGMEGLRRPLSLDPTRTWNAFFASLVPLTTAVLVASQSRRRRYSAIIVVICIGFVSAALGMLQLMTGDALYHYRYTHGGYPVGLFANKNHQAALLVWLILSTSWASTQIEPRRHPPSLIVGGVLMLVLFLFALVVLAGSRAGLILSAPALAVSLWLLFQAPAMKLILDGNAGRRKLLLRGITALMVAPLVFVFFFLALSGRQSALSRLFELDASEDLRWEYLPILLKMVVDFFPFGAGFGSFEAVFNLYEPAESLTSRYMNQAHNDFLQILIEGGLPALVILLVASLWLARLAAKVWHQGGGARITAIYLGSSLAVWIGASIVDYPLRTPLGAMIVSALTAQLAFLSYGRAPVGGPRRDRHRAVRRR